MILEINNINSKGFKISNHLINYPTSPKKLNMNIFNRVNFKKRIKKLFWVYSEEHFGLEEHSIGIININTKNYYFYLYITSTHSSFDCTGDYKLYLNENLENLFNYAL